MKRDGEWLELELENWARWSLGRATRGHCGSVEHRYCAAYWGEDEGLPQSVVPIDTLRALACERAVIDLPRRPQPYPAIVVAHYLRRGRIDRHIVVVPVGRIGYKMAVRTYYRALDQARSMIKNLLTRGTKHDEIRYAGVKPSQKSG